MIKKILFSTHMLNGEANYWWDTKKDLERTSFMTLEYFTK